MSVTKLARPRTIPPVRLHVRMPPDLKKRGAQVAVDRYGWTVTKLMRRLLEREVGSTSGLIGKKLK